MRLAISFAISFAIIAHDANARVYRPDHPTTPDARLALTPVIAGGVRSIHGAIGSSYDGHRVVWVPAEGEPLHNRLLVSLPGRGQTPGGRCNDGSA